MRTLLPYPRHLAPAPQERVASMSFLLPSVVGSTLGAMGGAALGEGVASRVLPRLGLSAEALGRLGTPARLLGTAVGQSVGKQVGSAYESPAAPTTPTPHSPPHGGHTYATEALNDIPPWARQTALALRGQ